MKLLIGLLIAGCIGLLWSVSSKISQHELNELVASGKIPYGPLPDVSHNYYSFDGLHSAFDSKVDLKRVHEFSKNEFEDLILKTLNENSKENFKKFIVPTLALSQDYQIDPFWIISIMMVESGFDQKALSPKNARGLMQIKPDTALHLYQLMGKKISENDLHNNLHEPEENIEVGIFYLKKLLQNFRLNYGLATIAYNVGPNKLKDLLVTDEIDTVHFSYLVKVKDCYSVLTKKFNSELKKKPMPYEDTFVVRGQGRKLEDHLLKLYVSASAVINSDLLLSSENLSKNNSDSQAL